MSQELTGHRVLVVEDEFFLASEIEDALTRAGSDVVGPIPDPLGAIDQVLADGFDLAVLDINLGGDLVFPVADALAERGVPFLFASAYPGSGVPSSYRDRPLIVQPYVARELIAGVLDLVRGGDVEPKSLGFEAAKPS
jgi:CheY-like chemotaxis protein